MDVQTKESHVEGGSSGIHPHGVIGISHAVVMLVAIESLLVASSLLIIILPYKYVLLVNNKDCVHSLLREPDVGSKS